MAIFLIVFAALLPVLIGIFLLLDRGRTRQIERNRHLRRVGYSTRDLFLSISPFAVFLALMAFSIFDPVRHLLIWLASTSLARLCDGGIPLMYCWPGGPMNSFLGAILISHFVFVLGSALFVRRIVFGNYDKPKNYDLRPVSGEAALGSAIIWLFILWGGYLFGKLAAPFGPPFGVMLARQICLWIRFRKSSHRPHE